MNKNLLWMTGALWLAAASLMTGCSNDTLLPDEETNPSEKGECFTLYASTDVPGSDSRLVFDEQGINLKWENGDQLMLVSVDDKVAPIYLTTSLSEPSATAAFQSESAVPAGEYYVKNVGRRGRNSRTDSKWQMRFGKYDSSTVDNAREFSLGEGELQLFSATNTYTTLNDAIDLYSEPISIADAQTSANITLKHAYAMIKFNLSGTDSFQKGGIKIGAICPTKGFVIESQMNEDGTFTPIQQCFKALFTDKLSVGDDENQLDNIDNMGALICPVDLSDHKVYFYVAHCQDEMNFPESNPMHVLNCPHIEAVYEFVKDGINLQGGVCYTVSLDLGSVTPIQIDKEGSLSTPAHFRALAYHYGANDSQKRKYEVTQDIDFTGELVFPIYGTVNYNDQTVDPTIDGGGHTLSNLTITNWPLNNVGLFASGIGIKDLNLENVNIDCPNSSFVGAFIGTAGNGALMNCSLVGENTINGKSYVGGLCGGAGGGTFDLSGCSVSDGTAVTGTGEHIGGLAGYIRYASKCESAATISGNGTYVGGIAGSSTNTISECTFTGNVSGNEYVGGIKGGYNKVYDGSISRCANHGTVDGKNYVGGIVGYGYDKIELSYSIGNVTGETYVGGISGHSNEMKNCYALSKVTGNEGAETVAGISGSSYNPVEYCYYAGEVSSGYGILGANNDPDYYIANCITTETYLSPGITENAGITSILASVNIINKESVYSTSAENVWENYPGNCPKFLWQINAMNAGEGSGIKAPAFSTSTW